MSDSSTVFTNIGEILTLSGAASKEGRHVVADDLTPVRDAVLVSRGGRVAWVGPRRDFRASMFPSAIDISMDGATVIPGFVECHTHLIYGGSRTGEFEWRVQGQSYREIAAKGGGILSTVRATRALGDAEMLGLAQARADDFVRRGVTTLEVKSGYGLDLESEIRSLRVAGLLRGPDLVRTYLGAHACPPEFSTTDGYLQFVLGSVLPAVSAGKWAERVDVYIEKGFFDVTHARALADRARALGLALVAHAGQFSDIGGVDLAIDMGALSVDHVVHLGAAAATRLAKSALTAVLLPAADFYLKMDYPPARALLDQGGRVALSTDFNPGTSPTRDLGFVGVLARLEMKMTLAEVISAFTVSAAHALGRGADRGDLTQGKRCDFAVLDCDWRDLFQFVGDLPVRATFREGECLWTNN